MYNWLRLLLSSDVRIIYLLLSSAVVVHIADIWWNTRISFKMLTTINNINRYQKEVLVVYYQEHHLGSNPV